MKKYIIALSLLLPFGAFASSVSISGVSVSGNSFTGNGSASYTGGDTLSVSLDGANLLSGGTDTSWSVSGNTSAGKHTLTANVGGASDSRDFTLGQGGGLAPCQIDKTCPHFGFFAPRVYMEDLGSVPTWRYLNPGQEGCPAFFTQKCIIR